MCSFYDSNPCGGNYCFCHFLDVGDYKGICIDRSFFIKTVDEDPNLCQTHAECTKKGSGNFCGRYPNPNIKYGRCFASNTEAEEFSNKFSYYSSRFIKDFLNMPVVA